MKEYTLSQKYALIGLDGLCSNHMSMAKKAAARGIMAGVLLENIMADAGEMTGADFAGKLTEGLVKVKKMKRIEADRIEKETARLLIADGVLEEAPDLLGCDMNYYTASVSIKAYRTDGKVRLSIMEELRAEILEDGAVTEECISLLWLCRESGCIHEIFSIEEQNRVNERLIQLSAENDIYRILWEEEFYHSLEGFSATFLKGKKKLFQNPYAEGVNVLFPFLDRRQAIFVDYVILGTSVADRRIAMMNFLTERGHYVEEVKNGGETLLKIDNICYRVFPKTVRCKFPIQGASLVPVYW